MKVYFPKDLPLNFNTTITIGSFDGVHLGHIALFEKTNQLAQQLKVEPLVVSFDPHPRNVLFPQSNFKLLTTLEEKLYLLSQIGIKNLAIIPFTKSLAEFSPELFIQDYIIDKFKAKGIVIGFDFRFGKERKGNAEYLKKLSEKYHFIVEIISPVVFDGIVVSSSLIRKFIENAQLEEANKLLGRPYFILGKVIKGKERGKLIGFPTANLEIHPLKLLPPAGVYAVWVIYKDKKFKGALNIGIRPTFDEKELSVEVHILNFNKDIYGEIIKIEFIKYIRNELKFSSIEDLKKQIKKDCELIDNILS